MTTLYMHTIHLSSKVTNWTIHSLQCYVLQSLCNSCLIWSKCKIFIKWELPSHNICYILKWQLQFSSGLWDELWSESNLLHSISIVRTFVNFNYISRHMLCFSCANTHVSSWMGIATVTNNASLDWASQIMVLAL